VKYPEGNRPLGRRRRRRRRHEWIILKWYLENSM
jgi:hypothetical protein